MSLHSFQQDINNSHFGDRIRLLADAKFGGFIKNLTDAAKIPYSTLNEFCIKKKEFPKTDLILRILKVAQDVNPMWLAFGWGTMREGVHVDAVKEPEIIFGQVVPFRNKSVDDVHFDEVTRQLPLYRNYTLPNVAPADFLDRVNMDDMAPYILPGDIIGMRILSKGEPYQFGKTYLIETLTGNYLKRVMPGAKNELSLESANKLYPSFKIDASTVLGAALVTEIIGRR